MSPSQSVADLGEHGLITRLRARVPAPSASVILGIGDDAAVLAPPRGEQLVVTTDGLVEDVHFKRTWTPLEAVGYKALAVNLSDLAAMGASAQTALLSLALPADLLVTDFDAIVDGFLSLAGTSGTALVGGNITRSPGPLMIDVTAIGTARPRRVVTRGGGRAGDELYVTGRLGAAGAGLAILRGAMDPVDRSTLGPDLEACVARYERPEPRLRAGVMAGRSRAVSAAMDLSDGLADAVRQIAAACGTGAIVHASAIPVHPGARAWAERTGADALGLALAAGEDYELLFVVPRRRRRSFLETSKRWMGLPVTLIGSLTRDVAVCLDRDGHREPLPAGFVHF
jgi:thiamine-monophosphate kinase